MKFRKSFVTNSSSCSFLIENLSDERKALSDLAQEFADNLTVESALIFYRHYENGIEELKQEIVNDAPKIIMEPHSSVKLECYDDMRNAFGGTIYYDVFIVCDNKKETDNLRITMLESHR